MLSIAFIVPVFYVNFIFRIWTTLIHRTINGFLNYCFRQEKVGFKSQCNISFLFYIYLFKVILIKKTTQLMVPSFLQVRLWENTFGISLIVCPVQEHAYNELKSTRMTRKTPLKPIIWTASLKI